MIARGVSAEASTCPRTHTQIPSWPGHMPGSHPCDPLEIEKTKFLDCVCPITRCSPSCQQACRWHNTNLLNLVQEVYGLCSIGKL